MIYGNAVAIDGGEVELSIQIDGGEIELNTFIDGGEQGIFYPVYPDMYTGETVVIPKAHEAQILLCKDKTMPDDVTVTKVPYFETSNDSGTTVYIASRGEING